MNYWIIVDNKPAGPYEGEQLVKAGLKDDTLVWREGYADWVDACRVPELLAMMRERDIMEARCAAAEPEAEADEPTAQEPAEAGETPRGEVTVEEVTTAVTETTVITDEESAPEAEEAPLTASTVVEEVVVEEEPARQEAWEPRREERATYCAAQESRQEAPQQQPQQPQPQQMVMEPCPPAYIAWSVIVTVLCCTVVGVVAIIYSSMTKSAYYRGDLAKSKKYSEIAQWLIIASIVCGTALAPFQMILMNLVH